MKILFVCAGNAQRSPTFEKYFKDHYPKFEIKSCGIWSGFPFILNKELLNWADKVLVMDLEQTKHIYEYFPEVKNKIETIGISDQYTPDSPELIELINFWIVSGLAKKNGIDVHD